MDVYVVVEDGSVIGVGMTSADAEEIADRAGYEGSEAWRDWRYGTGKQVRTREAPNGVWTYEARQEIVAAPLAGYGAARDGSTDPISDMRRARGEGLARLGYAQEVQEIGRTWGAP